MEGKKAVLGIFEVIKHLVIGIGLVILLPYISYLFTRVITPELKMIYLELHPLKRKKSDSLKEIERKQERLKKPDFELEKKKKELKVEISKLDKQISVIQERYNKKRFFISFFLGIIALLFGAFLALPSVGAGLIGGGIATLVVGFGQYWGRLSDLIKLVSLIGAVILLILLAYITFKRVAK